MSRKKEKPGTRKEYEANREVGYAGLFAEIYKLAVKDDCATVSGHVRARLKNKYGINDKMASDYIKANNEFIKQTVRKNIVEEAYAWGSGETKRMQAESIDGIVDYLVDNFRR